MLFNSIDFALFLPIVFVLYWFVFSNHLRSQNLLIVVASYYFYGFWDLKCLGLLVFSSLLDFGVGIGLGKNRSTLLRRSLLGLSLCINLGLLVYFMYYNFFVENFIAAFTFLGYQFDYSVLKVILPVGISFYTFQTMSYSIDVYKGALKPCHDLISFLAYVCFFPQLVAGPIERAVHLMPQFNTQRSFDLEKSTDGMRQILWGLFKKVVIADNCAEYVNLIFDHSQSSNGSSLLCAALLFSFQIYGDFSGYSDIAIGTSRLFGFDLKRNFHFPYFSKNVAEFWRRWHISLTTWFRDYLYIPLGGSRVSVSRKVKNTLIVFVVSGFWHGASWTFVVWGILNALLFLPSIFFERKKEHNNTAVMPHGIRIKEVLSILLTFLLISFTWIFFRADSIQQALLIISKIFSGSIFYAPLNVPKSFVIALLIAFVWIEWVGRWNEFAIQKFGLDWSKGLRYVFYYAVIFTLFWFGGNEQQFIYFQF